MANTKARTALDQIHTILNGEEWDSDTTSAIAEVITEYGYTIYNPDLDDEGKANAPLPPEEPSEYTYEHVEAAACMWEHVLAQLNRRTKPDPKVNRPNPWDDYREAYGVANLRQQVIGHAFELEAAYQAAVANGYDKAFDWEYVPKYMEDHITRILA